MDLKDLGGWRVDLQPLEGWEDKSATGTRPTAAVRSAAIEI